MILKPASDTPLTALLMAKILADAGVPEGVVSVLPARRSGAVVSAMVHDPRVRKLSFTGSTEVGRVLLKEAADQVVNCSMELGGNAPFLVFEDADLDAAIDGAMIAKMRNAGEACTAANRFYVHADVAEEFSRRLAERMKALTVGPGTHDDTQVGPLVNEESAAKVDELVKGAVSAGARVVLGGERPDREGFYYSPTVLLDVPRGADILGEEIFGPVAPVLTFTDEDDADRDGQRHRVRPGLLRLHPGPGARPPRQRAPRRRHGRAQPRPRLRPRRPLRRHEAVGHRPRGRARGDARLHGEQVRRCQLVRCWAVMR